MDAKQDMLNYNVLQGIFFLIKTVVEKIMRKTLFGGLIKSLSNSHFNYMIKMLNPPGATTDT